MEVFHPDFIGELLGFFKIADFQKGIIFLNIGNGVLLKFAGQQVVPVEIELELKRTPGGNTPKT